MSETATLATKQNPLQYVTDQLNELRSKGVAPKLRVLEGEQRPVCVFDGQEVINLASNNYLGLTTHKALRKAALDAVKRYGAGAGAVRAIAGTMRLHMELEEQIASFKKVEACVVFQSGFTANAGTVSAVLGKEDLIVSDELNHASIIDGARLSKATIKIFKHKDVPDCERILQEHASFPGKKLIITDGVFSMDGDIAPLPGLAALAQRHDAWLMSDDAHGLGVVGGGRGSNFVAPTRADVPLQMGTLSKALGAYGGYLCASAAVVDLIRNRARTVIYSTGLPPAMVAAAIAALDVIEREPAYAALPLAKAKAFARLARLPEPVSPIVPVLLGEAEAALKASRLLEDEGFLVVAIRPPTVPMGTARLRLTFTAQHPDHEVERLAALVRTRILAHAPASAAEAQ